MQGKKKGWCSFCKTTWSTLICCSAKLHSRLTIWSTERIHSGPLACELVARHQYRWSISLIYLPLPVGERGTNWIWCCTGLSTFFPLNTLLLKWRAVGVDSKKKGNIMTTFSVKCYLPVVVYVVQQVTSLFLKLIPPPPWCAAGLKHARFTACPKQSVRVCVCMCLDPSLSCMHETHWLCLLWLIPLIWVSPFF